MDPCSQGKNDAGEEPACADMEPHYGQKLISTSTVDVKGLSRRAVPFDLAPIVARFDF
jgi:hypothetical protein